MLVAEGTVARAAVDAASDTRKMLIDRADGQS